MSDKKQLSLLSMVMTLLIISSVAAAALGATYEATKGPIKQVKLKKKLDAIGKVVPKFDNNPNDPKVRYTVKEYPGLTFYPAKKNGVLVGTAVETYTKKGFSGDIKLMVGFLPDGTINEIEVLDHKETPGLGSKMGEYKFKGQFSGKDPKTFKLKVKKDGGDVDAITASTISSRAFGDGVQRAYDAYMSHMKGGK